MKESVIDEYIQELPRELVKAIKPLSNEKELALYVCIMKDGPARFSELKEKFGAHPQELITKLNSLMAAGLIERIADISDESFAEVNHYTISELGESMMRSMVKGALYINSYPDCLKRIGKCNQDWNDQSSMTVKLSDSGAENLWLTKKFVKVNEEFVKDITKQYHVTPKLKVRSKYEPKTA